MDREGEAPAEPELRKLGGSLALPLDSNRLDSSLMLTGECADYFMGI
jgi:hypothetical protein